MTETEVDPRLTAAIDMLGRTGALSVQMRYSDDELPTVWFAVGEYLTVDGVPVPAGTEGGHPTWETAAGHDLIEAVMRLCERVIDGGQCAHCHKPAAFLSDIDPTILDEFVCWTQWDPELATFRRGCEGESP